MQAAHANRAEESRLRFVFDGGVVSLNRAVDVSVWEIAEAMDDLRERYGEPLAIDVTLGSRLPPVPRS